MNIIIFYEHLVREWVVCKRLQVEFEKEGDRVLVASIIFERFKALRDARKNKPDIIFVPWFVDEEHERMMSVYIDINPDVRIINLHQEQIGSKNSEPMLLPRTAFTKNGSFHFVWGDYFKSRLLAAGVDDNKIIITGNTRMESENYANVSKVDLARTYGLNADKKWILFAENRGWILGKDAKKAHDLFLSRGMAAAAVDQIVETEKTNIEGLVNELRHLDRSFSKTYEFIYRPHPGTVCNYEVPECVHIIGERPIRDWITNCDLFLTCESTSIFEAEMLGKPCAIVPSIVEPDDNAKMAGVWEYPVVKSLLDITDDLILHVTEENQNSGPIYSKYMGINDGGSPYRIVRASKEIMKISILEESKRYSRLSLKGYVRQACYEIVTRIVVGMGLLDRIKFPHSAYVEKRDIPYSSENAWIHM